MAAVKIKSYASPGCILLAFDWPDGKDHPDFLGKSETGTVALMRDPRGGQIAIFSTSSSAISSLRRS
jgi:hypothetical protein